MTSGSAGPLIDDADVGGADLGRDRRGVVGEVGVDLDRRGGIGVADVDRVA